MTYTSSSLPSPLCAMASCQVASSLYLYGGTDGTAFLSTLYRLDLETMTLYQMKTDLPGRIAASMTHLKDSNELVIFGGSMVEQEDNQFSFIQLSQAVFEKSVTL